jgi:hypothetical protein
MKKISRLRKIAEIEDLGEKNIPSDFINQILVSKEINAQSETLIYRHLMNANSRFVVEIWQLSDKSFAVISGHFNGQWTLGDIEYDGPYESQSEAEMFVQTELQGQAETPENIL